MNAVVRVTECRRSEIELTWSFDEIFCDPASDVDDRNDLSQNHQIEVVDYVDGVFVEIDRHRHR